ncbi:MAG: diguanylate cyclase [Pseudomonadota bacterium]|nr:diguanylate cyclase [Gammaproteobacteria bacterium]MBU1559150.1 diguanylate cyclase [Gammaproteobacteria bacterium]MBU1628858.1 diguanylate cyclase [Gammaproteobacteria bacterium]MBU1926420.1 diguanylate cyclase [Gammaproteobacteria bacterium]MBU2545762.1 diguanylate cyclase [Gammaproteobacteria bacterium]
MKILTADDSKTFTFLLKASLEKLGHTVVSTYDPKQVADLFLKEKPDLVILDVVMSEEMNGFDCAREIRKVSDPDEWIPIIFLSAMFDDQHIEEGIQSGGDDYLTKPFSEITLAAKILAMQRIAEMRAKLIRTTEKLAQANEKLYQLSYTDGLTKISNRRAFNQDLDETWDTLSHRASKNKLISLIMIDIDHFKFYNDSYGHQAGDVCLEALAKTLNDNLKQESAKIYRYGGEEFVVLLPNLDSEAARKIAEHLRQSIIDLKMTNVQSKNLGGIVTISLGVSSTQANSSIDPLMLLNASDMALYEAKNQGRNCVVVKNL